MRFFEKGLPLIVSDAAHEVFVRPFILFGTWKRRREVEIRLRKLDESWDRASPKVRDDLKPDIIELREYLENAAAQALIARGSRCNVHLWLHVPLPQGEESHWRTGTFGDDTLHPSSFAELQRLVEEAEHEQFKRTAERREIWFKITTVIGALVGASTGIYTAFFKR